MPGEPIRGEPLYVGIDVGTSGVRAAVIDAGGAIHALGRSAMQEFGDNLRDPHVWWRAVDAALLRALAAVDSRRIVALCVDGTSGTVLAVDAAGAPLADARMYNDLCESAPILARIAETAPASSAARGPTSGLAKAILLALLHPAAIVHQADWIAARFSGRLVSDANNALKTGFDPVEGRWPDWIEAAGMDSILLPDVLEPGEAVGTLTAEAARQFGLRPDVRVVAGTTDGCASFLATGAAEPGDGVTALGTTLTLKLLSDRPVFEPKYGIYSHRILGMWLAGGASNSGGNVLLSFFPAADIAALSSRIDAGTETGLDYYPLARPGERFPFADPGHPPRVTPRPDCPEDFLKALLEGIADIEKLGYDRLAELGAPPLASVRSVGGGAANVPWTRMRARRLGVPLVTPLSDEAAYGAALLARRGA